MKPPGCVEGCDCKGNQICKNGSEGKCICPLGRKEPDCKRCGKDCGKIAFCSIVVKSKEEQCFCMNGGVYPNCADDKCDKTCKENEICVKKNQKSECICKSLIDQCTTPCNKECGSSGKCVLSNNGKEKCICADGSDNFPDCDGPCLNKVCKSGKCIVKNKKPFCPCPDHVEIDEDDSNCDPCAILNCEKRGEKLNRIFI